MMRHIFGATAIPLPPPVNQLQHNVGRRAVGVEEKQLCSVQIQNTPSRLHQRCRRFMISNGLGRGVIVLSHISSLANSSLPIFPPHLWKNQFMKINTRVSSPGVQVDLDFAHVSAALFPRGLIIFTCHIRFIPSNVILPRYWEHLFAPRPWMEVLERVHFPQSLADFFITLQRRHRTWSLAPRWDRS